MIYCKNCGEYIFYDGESANLGRWVHKSTGEAICSGTVAEPKERPTHPCDVQHDKMVESISSDYINCDSTTNPQTLYRQDRIVLSEIVASPASHCDKAIARMILDLDFRLGTLERRKQSFGG